MTKSILRLDLHDEAKNAQGIEDALLRLVDQAKQKRVKKAEIIPGKGTGQLMIRVKKFLDRKEIKPLYKRIEIDSKNHGRLFVHFR